MSQSVDLIARSPLLLLCVLKHTVAFELLCGLGGGEVLGNYVLRRCYCVHFLFPFAILGFSHIHLLVLHQNKSKFLLSYCSGCSLPFGPYYLWKDTAYFGLNIGAIAGVCSYAGIDLIHADNFIAALPNITPALIEPEGYYLPFYAVLRLVPHKLIGVFALVMALLILALIPQHAVLNDPKCLCKVLIANMVLLGNVGRQSIKYPGIELSLLLLGNQIWLFSSAASRNAGVGLFAGVCLCFGVVYGSLWVFAAIAPKQHSWQPGNHI